MTRYAVASRGKTRGTFAIYPCGDCWDGDKLKNELGRVKAWSRKEAQDLAVKRGIGESCEIWAIEIIDNNRVTVLE